MKNVLLTAALIAAAVASGDLLAKATSPKHPAARAAAVVADATLRSGDTTRDRPRTLTAWLDGEKPIAK